MSHDAHYAPLSLMVNHLQNMNKRIAFHEHNPTRVDHHLNAAKQCPKVRLAMTYGNRITNRR